MDMEFALPATLLTLAVLFGTYVAGHSAGEKDANAQCINYYSDMTVVDARVLCSKIAVGKK